MDSLQTKYFGVQEDGHGGFLHWPGTPEGYPVRTSSHTIPYLKDDEYDNIKRVCDFYIREFNLSSKDDLDVFREIMDKHYNGWYTVVKRDDTYDKDQKAWIVKLEWLQMYGELPPDARAL